MKTTDLKSFHYLENGDISISYPLISHHNRLKMESRSDTKRIAKIQAQFALDNKLRTREQLVYLKKRNIIDPDLEVVRNDLPLANGICLSKVVIVSNEGSHPLEMPWCIKNESYCIESAIRESKVKPQKVTKIIVTNIKQVGESLIE